MLTWEIIVAWSVLMCGGDEKATENCVRWANKCLVKEYVRTLDEDLSFENCAENLPISVMPR